MPKPIPPFGLAHTVPDDALAAWGARLIVRQDGYIDLPPDRQGSDQGPRSDELFRRMGEVFPLPRLLEDVGRLLRAGDMDTRAAGNVVLYKDEWIEIHADTKASAGYCYVTAWLKPYVADDQRPYGIWDPRGEPLPE